MIDIVICLLRWKTLKFEADTLFYANLNSNCQNLPNKSYTHEGQFGEICLTKLRCKNSVTQTEQQKNVKTLNHFLHFWSNCCHGRFR